MAIEIGCCQAYTLTAAAYRGQTAERYSNRPTMSPFIMPKEHNCVRKIAALDKDTRSQG